MNSSQIEGDIDMETFHLQKGNVMVECNREREDIGSSKRFKGSQEINEKKLIYADVIHVEEADKDNCNWDNLWVIVKSCCLILWKIMKMKQKNALMRMCMM